MNNSCSSPRTIFVIAGETSGDKIAADLICSVDKLVANVCWRGMGGPAMLAAGVAVDVDYRNYAVMGLWDVVRQFYSFFALKRKLVTLMRQAKPACLICVDYPGFNLSLAQSAKAMGIPVIYYVSPKTWASRSARNNRIKSCVDQLFCILPFEPAYFSKHNIDAKYVGHPLLASIPARSSKVSVIKTVALLPGSRKTEIKRLAPLMCQCAVTLSKSYQLDFIIPVANQEDISWLQQLFSDLLQANTVRFISHDDEAIAAADYAIVASGTATLELAKRGIPMMVVYRLDWPSYLLAKRMVTVQYVSLCNLIANKIIVPELLQSAANVANMVAIFDEIYNDQAAYVKMRRDLDAVVNMMGSFEPESVHQAIINCLN